MRRACMQVPAHDERKVSEPGHFPGEPGVGIGVSGDGCPRLNAGLCFNFGD